MLFGEACTRAGRVCGLVLGRGQEVHREERDRSRLPILSPTRSPAHSPPVPLARTKRDTGRRAPFLPRLPRPNPHPYFQDTFHSGTLPGAAHLPPRAGALRFPPGASSVPAKKEPPPPGRRASSVPLRVSPTLRSPAGHPSPGAGPQHSPPSGSGRARLGPAGPRGGGGGTSARAGRTAGAHRRTGALAPALPHRRPLRTPTRTRRQRAPGRLSGGRERGSPRNPWNEAPPALSAAPPGSARPDRPRPRPRPSPRRWGRAQVSRRGGASGAERAGRGSFPFPRPPRAGGGQHPPGGCGRARGRVGRTGPSAAPGPRRRLPSQGARVACVSHTSRPPGPAGGNTA